MPETKVGVAIGVKDDTKSGLASATSNMEKFKKGVESAALKLGAIAAGAIAFDAVKDAVVSSLQAFQESEAQLARVDTILGTLSDDTLAGFGGSIEAAQQAARDFGDEIQKVGGISSETASEGFAKLLQSTGDVATATEAANVAADLATMKQIDYASAIDMVNKTLAGSDRVFTEMGVTMDENATKEERLAALAAKTAGQYEAYGQTAEGRNKVLKETFGDLQEAIGQSLQPVLDMLIPKLIEIAEAAGKWITENQGVIQSVLNTAFAVGEFLVNAIIKVIGFIGFLIEEARKVISYFMGFDASWGEIWNSIAEQVQLTFDVLLILWQGMVEGVTAFFNSVQTIWNALVGAFNVVKGVLVTAVENVKSVWNEGWTSMSSTFNGIWEGIKKVIGDAVSWITKQITQVMGFVNSLIGAANTVASIAGGAGAGVLKAASAKVPKAAAGGIVTRPTMVLAGEGGESEAIIPLSKLNRFGGGGDTYHIYIQGGNYLDRDAGNMMGDQIYQTLNKNIKP